ncbi:MAG: MOSC domain-containing protein, partial [Betaproteobacteria bacterium]|nr:MOSC domain-containing protein [Betaproteobacteria bacterium]
SKAVYALPFEHLSWWQSQRQAHGVTLFEETLTPGFLGENLSLMGVLESDLYVGDCLDFGQVLLRVTQPREPCGKFNAIMGYAQAAKDMVLSGRCGFYLAVDRPGLIQAGDSFEVIPGPRSIGIVQVLQRQAWRFGR